MLGAPTVMNFKLVICLKHSNFIESRFLSQLHKQMDKDAEKVFGKEFMKVDSDNIAATALKKKEAVTEMGSDLLVYSSLLKPLQLFTQKQVEKFLYKFKLGEELK